MNLGRFCEDKVAVKFVEHTADIRMRVEAPSLAELFTEAAQGMVRYIFEPESAPQKKESRRVSIEGVDKEDLLINWLSRILYYAEAEHLIPVSINIFELSEETLAAEAEFGSLEPKHEIKAVTHHGLSIGKTNSSFEAEVTFDV